MSFNAEEAVAKPVDAIVPIASKWKEPSLSDAFETNASTCNGGFATGSEKKRCGAGSKIEKEIAALEEYRKSLITKCVTKGLDPNAKLKPSGVDWIGEVSDGVPLRRLRYVVEIATGNQDTQDADEDGDYPFYVRSPIVEHSSEYTFEGTGLLSQERDLCVCDRQEGGGRMSVVVNESLFKSERIKMRKRKRMISVAGSALVLSALLQCFTGCVWPECATYQGAKATSEQKVSDEYLFSKVDSGVVPAEIELSYRYRVISCRVQKRSLREYVEDRYIDSLACESHGEAILPELEAMYPGVFFTGAASLNVVIDLIITDVYSTPNAGWPNSLKGKVIVRDAATGKVMGEDGFVSEYGFHGTSPTVTVVESECQTYYDEQEMRNHYWDLAKHIVFEGFAGSAVAALDKFEHGGARSVVKGKGARFAKVVHPAQRRVSSESDDGNPEAAVNFLMGSMDAINSMNNARHLRHEQRRLKRQSTGVSGKRSSVQGSSPVVANTLSQTANAQKRTCPVCGGNGKCRPCNGKGKIGSVEEISNDRTSGTVLTSTRATSVMAQSRITCRPCGGTGNCRACGGTGSK